MKKYMDSICRIENQHGNTHSQRRRNRNHMIVNICLYLHMNPYKHIHFGVVVISMARPNYYSYPTRNAYAKTAVKPRNSKTGMRTRILYMYSVVALKSYRRMLRVNLKWVDSEVDRMWTKDVATVQYINSAYANDRDSRICDCMKNFSSGYYRRTESSGYTTIYECENRSIILAHMVI